jgi:DNA modification methylase
MPTLTWASKTPTIPIQAELHQESIIFPQGNGYPAIDPKNQLILGDNLAVMSALIPEYQGRIDLIYADPPFFTNRRYPARVGRGEDSRRPQEWQLAEGYPDHWPDIDSYLDMLYPRLRLMYQLLAPTGTLYLHLDWHANHYARLLLDEIFGPDRLLNEIVWVYHGPSPIRTAFNRKHDTILSYTKSPDYTFNVDAVRQPYNPNTVKTFESSPKAGFGKVPNLKRGKVPEDWWYFPVVARLHNERTGYPTQKPEALLERIILASSNPGDLVADFFCGSGTTPLVASRLDRRFIANDGTWRAVHTTRSRLVERTNHPFSFLRESNAQIPVREAADTKTFLKVTLDPESSPDQTDGSYTTLVLDTTLLDDIDYWEADPAWDRQQFRSAAQNVRPRKQGMLNPQIHIPEAPGNRPVCTRFVFISGEQTQIVVKRPTITGG